jgi:hypothetical protein
MTLTLTNEKFIAVPVMINIITKQESVVKKSDRINYSGFELMPGSDLLSHEETPHYLRRRSVSLLSSGDAVSRWDQVGLEAIGSYQTG